MVQHWMHRCKLNKTLIDLVKFLAIGYEATKRPFDPLVALWMCNLDATEKDTEDEEIIRYTKEK